MKSSTNWLTLLIVQYTCTFIPVVEIKNSKEFFKPASNYCNNAHLKVFNTADSEYIKETT